MLRNDQPELPSRPSRRRSHAAPVIQPGAQPGPEHGDERAARRSPEPPRTLGTVPNLPAGRPAARLAARPAGLELIAPGWTSGRAKAARRTRPGTGGVGAREGGLRQAASVAPKRRRRCPGPPRPGRAGAKPSARFAIPPRRTPGCPGRIAVHPLIANDARRDPRPGRTMRDRPVPHGHPPPFCRQSRATPRPARDARRRLRHPPAWPRAPVWGSIGAPAAQGDAPHGRTHRTAPRGARITRLPRPRRSPITCPMS